MKNRNSNTQELFGIIPQMLTSSPKFNNGEFRVLCVCISIDNIELEDGSPFTLSVGSLSKMTGMSPKQIGRIITRLEKMKILKVCGYKIQTVKRYEVKYPIYKFNYDVLKSELSISDKMSVTVINEDKVYLNSDDSILDNLSDKVSDKVSDKMSCRSNSLVEETSIKGISVEGKISDTTSDSTDILLEQIKGTVPTIEQVQFEEAEHDRLYEAINKSFTKWSYDWRQAVRQLNEQYPRLAIKF